MYLVNGDFNYFSTANHLHIEEKKNIFQNYMMNFT